MTKTEKASQELADMGVLVITHPLEKHKAVSSADGLLVVAAGQNDRECYTVLTHEKWHFKLGAFYRTDAPYAERCRCEAAVRRAAVRELVPKKRLAALLRRGLSVDEVAEALGVTETQIWEAWRYYRDLDVCFCAGRSGE